MPDFERIIRSLEVYLATTAEEKREIQAFHRGQDHARWEVVWVAAIIAFLVVVGVYVL